MSSPRELMQRAMTLAMKGRDTVSPNPMVGAVIVKNGRVIAEGWHRRCGGDHAEIIALKKAGPRARGATMFVTLEPCHHFGRTPPCADAVINSGIRQIHIGMKDPNPRTNGRSIRKLRAAGIRVNCGLLENELRALNEMFVTYVTRQRPFIVSKSAQTIDGKIATASGQSRWITGPQARARARKERDRFDAILVGVNTVIADDPRLTGTRASKRLKKIVLDSRLRIPETAKLLRKSSARDCLIATTSRAPAVKVKRLQARGAEVLVVPSSGGRVSLPRLMKELARREMASILIEGGAGVIGQALKDRLLDRMVIYTAPKILGDQNARSAVDGLKTAHVDRCPRLRDVRWRTVGQDLVMEGYVDYVHRTR